MILRTNSYAVSGPPSMYTAPISASRASDRIDAFVRPPVAASPLPSLM